MQSLSHILICFLLMISKLSTGQNMHVVVQQINCFNENTGSISITMDSSFNEDFTVIITDSANHTLSQFHANKQVPWEIKNMKPGKYFITLQTRDNASKETQIIDLINPEELKTNTVSIESISKGETQTFALKANPSGGVPPYKYVWSGNTGNQTSQIANNLKEGTYTCGITDANGCGPKVSTFFLYDPEIQKFKQQKKNK